MEDFGAELGLLIDDGPCRFGQPSSVVRVANRRWEMLRVGVVPQRTLARLSSLMVLFVCTGNTCRSPMAEMLCRDMLAKRLKCRIDELEDRGVVVMSAGLAGMWGGTAAREAVEAVADLGLDLSGHGTQPLTEPLVRHADVIYAMTRAHRDAIVEGWPSAAERTELLSADGSDICDPIGGPIDRYRHCLAQNASGTEDRLNELESAMRIAIGSDHRGFTTRGKVVELVRRLGHDAVDRRLFPGCRRLPGRSGRRRPAGDTRRGRPRDSHVRDRPGHVYRGQQDRRHRAPLATTTLPRN